MAYLKYLTKIDRYAAWILFFLMLLFFITGWSMTGRFQIIRPGLAQNIHTSLCILVFIFFLIHSGIQIYFAFKRWKRKK
ncbi:MAG TPA: hypothetical protein ENL45_01295 [Candidatus Woesearchaeota archaeon]|nr:hypothetical protein [Candidatus Woesearchaeota archaeon]